MPRNWFRPEDGFDPYWQHAEKKSAERAAFWKTHGQLKYGCGRLNVNRRKPAPVTLAKIKLPELK